jgi:hypothetical protein
VQRVTNLYPAITGYQPRPDGPPHVDKLLAAIRSRREELERREAADEDEPDDPETDS